MKVLTLLFSMLTAGVAFAQTPPQPAAQTQSDDQSITVTGCLSKDSGTGNYMVTDAKSGDKFSFTGSNKLDAYLNHTVELTGRMTMQGGNKSFQPRTIKSISESCGG